MVGYQAFVQFSVLVPTDIGMVAFLIFRLFGVCSRFEILFIKGNFSSLRLHDSLLFGKGLGMSPYLDASRYLNTNLISE
jgi:hypothetical protein